MDKHGDECCYCSWINTDRDPSRCENKLAIDSLKHDIERHLDICTELEATIAKQNALIDAVVRGRELFWEADAFLMECLDAPIDALANRSTDNE